MFIHPTTIVLGSLLFMAISAGAPRVKAASDTDRRDPSVREAQAAKQEARRGRLTENADAAQRERNRYARCDVHRAEEHEYCIRRMNGEGIVSGSVEGGGIYRELTVTVPAQ